MVDIGSALRPLGYTAYLGHSWVAQQHTDTQKYRKSGYSHVNWGNMLAGQRLTTAIEAGVSGERSDQIVSRLSSCINSGAGHLYIDAILNDVAQSTAGYTTVNTVGPNQSTAVTPSNVATVCSAIIKYMAQTFLAAGGRVVTICLAAGAENLTSAQIGAIIDIRAYLREFAETNNAILLLDPSRTMRDPTLSTTSVPRFKVGYAQEAQGSGTHESNLGGYWVGKNDFLPFVTANFPAVPCLPTDVTDVPTNSRRWQLANPLFIGTTGGTLGSGITGTAHTSWTVDRGTGSGTQTAAVSNGTPADGSPGKECIIACTFSAAGDIIRLRQDAVNANWQIGDFLQAMSNISVDSGGVLAGVYADLQQNDGSVTNLIGDMVPLGNVAIGTDGYSGILKTEKWGVIAKAGSPFVTLRLNIVASGAGNATVRFRQTQIEARFV